MNNKIEIREANSFTPDLEIDEGNCVVKNVKLLGAISKNGLEFPRTTREAAHRLMENAQCNWNHAPKGTKETALESRFGWFQNVREDVSGDCTRGDLHYYSSHPHVKLFLDIAKRNPKACGISIFGGATGEQRAGADRKTVTEITDISSLDLVADPANTMGLRESVEEGTVDPEEEKPKKAEGEDDYTAEGCLKAIEEIILAGQGSAREKIDEIRKHLEQLDELEEREDEDDDGKETVEESAKKKLRKDCIALCESHGVKDDGQFVTLLMYMPADKRESLIKRRAKVKKPVSGSPAGVVEPVRESSSQNAPLATSETWDESLDALARRIDPFQVG